MRGLLDQCCKLLLKRSAAEIGSRSGKMHHSRFNRTLFLCALFYGIFHQVKEKRKEREEREATKETRKSS